MEKHCCSVIAMVGLGGAGMEVVIGGHGGQSWGLVAPRGGGCAA